MHTIHDPLVALRHHRDLIAQRDQERTNRQLRRQARARRRSHRAERPV